LYLIANNWYCTFWLP